MNEHSCHFEQHWETLAEFSRERLVSQKKKKKKKKDDESPDYHYL